MLGGLGESHAGWAMAFPGRRRDHKDYDGVTKPSTIRLDTIEIWIQIHDVPDLYAHLVPQLAAKVGEVLFTEP